MQKFIPGKVLKEFNTRSGEPAILRYTKWEDLDELTKYVNEVSRENIYVGFSGEQLSRKEEAAWLSKLFKDADANERVQVLCIVDGKLAGAGTVNTKTNMLRRYRHIATLGIMIRKKYRGDGIGTVMMGELIKQAKTFLRGIRMVELSVFAENKPAIKLYKELGFREVGRIPGGLKHRGKYQDDVIMVLKIAG